MRSRASRLAILAVFVAALAGSILSTWLQQEAIASRSSGGTYSLPAGNPVVTGTTITSTWANNTLSDLSTELTDSLSRSGKGAMLAPLELANGTVALPALSFDSDPDTGLYRIGANNPAMSVSGVLTQSWSTTTSTFPLGVTVTQSQANTDALTATGNGSGVGVKGVGGATNGIGVNGVGGTDGAGGYFSGTGTGVGLIAEPGTAYTAAAPTNAVVLNGSLSFNVAPPNSDVAQGSLLNRGNLPKAWGSLSTSGGAHSVAAGFNVTGVAISGSDGNAVTVTLAQDCGNANYAVALNLNTSTNAFCNTRAKAAGTFDIQCSDGASEINLDTITATGWIDFIVFCHQ